MLISCLKLGFVLLLVATGVFLGGSWLTKTTIEPTQLVVTGMKTVDYLTTVTHQQQFLIDIPMVGEKHYTELVTTTLTAGIDLSSIQAVPTGKAIFRLAVPAARVISTSVGDAMTIRNGEPGDDVLAAYRAFARRWASRPQGSGMLLDEANYDAATYIHGLYDRAGARVDIVASPSLPATLASSRIVVGPLGNFRLDADLAASVEPCVDRRGECFMLGNATRLEVKVFDTERVREDDPDLSHMFDSEQGKRQIGSVRLDDASMVFLRWRGGGHLYALLLTAPDEQGLGAALPTALEMAFTFEPRALARDRCMSAGGVNATEWRGLSQSAKRAVWSDDVQAFGRIWPTVPALADGAAKSAPPITRLEVKQLLVDSDPMPVALDETGLDARSKDSDRFDSLFRREIENAASADAGLNGPNHVMMVLQNHNFVHRDRVLILTEKRVVEFVPPRVWYAEPETAKSFALNAFKRRESDAELKFSSRTGTMLDSVLPNISLESSDLNALMAWLDTDYSPFRLEKCAAQQQASEQE